MKYIRKDKFTRPQTPVDVLKLALEKEKSSYDFYTQMLREFKNPALKPTLTKLQKAELGHIQIISKMLNS
ncbi:MAG: hypothetical protein WC658_01355 [Candidatus Omnitrophota bacterium]